MQDAQEAAETARQEWQPAADTVAALEAELRECERRAANIAPVVSDESDLAARIEARSLRVAFAEEADALRQRIRLARQIADPLVQANGQTAAAVAKAQARLDELEEAVKLPFAHRLGRDTLRGVPALHRVLVQRPAQRHVEGDHDEGAPRQRAGRADPA